MTQTDSTKSPRRERTSRKRRKRPWPVTAVGLLLLLQAVGMLVLSVVYFGAGYLAQMGLLEQLLEQSAEEQLLSLLPTPVKVWVIGSLGAVNEELLARTSEVGFTSIGLLFIALSALALLAAIGFLRMRRNAWTVAMLGQGLSLLMALLIYFRGKLWYTYIMMLYNVPMVLYLNYHEVRAAFQPRQVRPQRARRTRVVRRRGR
jgi:hypothetical protein